MLRLPSTIASIVGAVLCFGLRFMAIRHGRLLPIARGLKQPADETEAPHDGEDDNVKMH